MGTRKRLVSSSTSEPSSSSDSQQTTQHNKPQEQSSDTPIAPPKWGFLLKLSLFFIPYFYLIFFHFSIDSELRRSIIINAGLSFAGFFVTVRMIPVATRYILKRDISEWKC
ncbi:UDP-N-acetylglucosamine-dolichyl-phosphate N-acetylglucosaminephosphotransferase-like protein [Trifolium pratense]|uniref:UDP-N-acetylglucosamine-dolichyl-phosphate N-acetylglucosaminephosphotransferase-like protein n=1 Tax=Trifolium pratense TaxID=57577 RepID=A0A2K3L5K4_TRIPR|nr:UDP-N-acetylglucosamine-dolichyl-phosphate N-acetylglucosaminephosphotransferase-like protein [Trifolium pratense]